MSPRTAARFVLFLSLMLTLLAACLTALPSSALAAGRAAKSHAAAPAQKHASHRPMLPYTSVKALQARIEGMKTAAEKKKLDDEEAGTDFLDSYLYFMKQRAYPNDTIDFSAYARGVAQRDRLAPATIGPKQTAQTFVPSNRWQFVGPTNLTVPYNTYYGNGPLSGRVNGLAYDTTTANTYYLAAAGGGLWKTTNGGTTWTCLSNSWTYQTASCVVIDPTNHNTIYCGTGDVAYGTYPDGIEKSTDGGTTWTAMGAATFGANAVSAIIVDPETPTTLTAAIGAPGFSNVYRSTDGGNTWALAFTQSGIWTDLKYGAKNASGVRHYYVASGYTGAGPDEELWRSDDRGATWTQVTIPATGTDYTEGLVVAPSKTAPDTVYLESGNDETIWKSTNAGASWSDITSGLTAAEPGLSGNPAYNWSQNSYDIALTCGAGTGGADTVYDSLIDLARSTDSGSTFTSIGGPTYNQSGSGAVLHNDQHAVAVNPLNSNDVLVGCDGGVFHYVFPSGGGVPTITSLNPNLGITQLYKAAYSPTNANVIVSGAQDNAGPYCKGTLSTWGNTAGGDGGGCAINQSNPSDQYASDQNLGMVHTTDGWASDSDITPTIQTGETPPFIATLALDPTHPNLLYTGTEYLYQYNSTTGTWTYDLGGQPLSGSATAYIQAIAVAPTNGSVIYTGSVDGEVWVSTTQGASWTEIDGAGGGANPLPGRAITSISISPTNASDVLVGISGTGGGHLYHCANTTQGANSVWTSLNGSGTSVLPDVPLNAVTRDPDSPTSTYYVGTDIGVFATTNSGASWTNATVPLGLPNVQVDDLQAVPGTHYLNAATFGRGIWRISLTATAQAPTVTSFTPTSGPIGTSVTITGTNFTGATSVKFNGTAATTFSVVSATSITATVPNGATTGTVSVTTSAGTGTSTSTFTVTTTSGVPTITSFSPTSGPVGTTVVITGTNFTGTTVVGFTNAHATSFTVNSTTQITTSVPSGAATGTIAVATPRGTAHSSASFTVTTSTVPTITSFTPTSGPVGTNVAITGTNFTGATAVKFNATTATTFHVASATGITATVPSGATTGKIAVTTPGGTATSSGTFTVTTSTVPTITSFSPTSGPIGTTVVIMGTNLTGATVVGFTNAHATSFTVNSSTQITTSVPSGAATGTIAVATPGGTAHSSASFTVTTSSVPTITSFTPTSGPVGTSVTITGTNFTGATSVKFNATTATTFHVASATSITATVPSGAATGKIAVTTPGGTATSSGTFTVTTSTVPTITGFSPTSGPIGTTVVITGTNLTGATVVGFTNAHATSFTVNSSTQITTSVPSGAVTGPIAVATPRGTAHSSASFTVTTGSAVALSTLTVNPSTVPQNTNFTLTATLTAAAPAGGASVAYTQNGVAQSPIVIPAGQTSGSVIYGSGTASGTFTYSATYGGVTKTATVTITTSSVPTITGFSPTSGPVGTTVVIKGTNLTGATVVGFTNAHATSFTVNSSTQITTSVPSGAVTGPIAVATPNGTAHSSASFTVTAPPITLSKFYFSPASVSQGSSTTAYIVFSAVLTSTVTITVSSPYTGSNNFSLPSGYSSFYFTYTSNTSTAAYTDPVTLTTPYGNTTTDLSMTYP